MGARFASTNIKYSVEELIQSEKWKEIVGPSEIREQFTADMPAVSSKTVRELVAGKKVMVKTKGGSVCFSFMGKQAFSVEWVSERLLEKIKDFFRQSQEAILVGDDSLLTCDSERENMITALGIEKTHHPSINRDGEPDGDAFAMRVVKSVPMYGNDAGFEGGDDFAYVLKWHPKGWKVTLDPVHRYGVSSLSERVLSNEDEAQHYIDELKVFNDHTKDLVHALEEKLSVFQKVQIKVNKDRNEIVVEQISSKRDRHAIMFRFNYFTEDQCAVFLKKLYYDGIRIKTYYQFFIYEKTEELPRVIFREVSEYMKTIRYRSRLNS